MKSTSVNEKMNLNPKTDILLAEKTLEILRLVEVSEVIIRSKFNNDPTHWMDAMLRVLVLRNAAYLWEERNAYSESQKLCQIIQDKLLSMYSEMEAAKQNNGNYRCQNYSDFMLTGSSLIQLFGEFTNLLVKNNGIVIDGDDFMDDAKLILKNIAKFISKHERETLAKTNDANEVSDNQNHRKSSSIPQSSTSTLSVDSTRPDDNISSNHMDVKVPNTSLINRKLEWTSKRYEGLYNNPCFSTLNKKSQSINCSVTSLTTEPKSSNVPATTSKPSRSLSEGDRSQSVDSLRKNVPKSSDMEATRNYLKSSLGDESSVFEVLKNRLHCTICNCEVFSLHNIKTHVTGKQHVKSLNAREDGKVVKPKSVNPSVAEEKIERKTEKSSSTSSDPGQVLQVSSTAVPVKLSLEL